MAAVAQMIPAATYLPDASADPQTPADVAVMMVTVLRPSIADALRSIYRQRFQKRIQVLVGIDVPKGSRELLDSVLAERPPHVSALVLHLPYSTASHNGGLHAPNDGGALRATLALTAQARHLAQLDDDNVWLPNHLTYLKAAIAGKTYAFSHRMLVDQETDIDLGPDMWDSVGPEKGRLAPLGGFVDPNCLMIDKLMLAQRLGRYADTPNSVPGWNSDRLVFSALRHQPHGRVTAVTVRYRIRRNHVLWPALRELKAQGGLREFDWGALEPTARRTG